MTAFTADYFTLKDILFFMGFSNCRFSIIFGKHILYLIEIIFGDNSFVCVLYNNPMVFIHKFLRHIVIKRTLCSSLHHISDIHFIRKDFHNCSFTPVFHIGIFIALKYTFIIFVFAWRCYPVFNKQSAD